MKNAEKKSAEVSGCNKEEPICAVVRIDLGDKRSNYHVLDLNGSNVGEGIVATRPMRSECYSPAPAGCG
jgi:hypothetical protein